VGDGREKLLKIKLEDLPIPSHIALPTVQQ